MRWLGGMVGPVTGLGSVHGWLPGLDSYKQCDDLPLWQGVEIAPSDTVVKGANDVMATTAETPTAAVVYAAQTPASGLNPKATNVYIQTIDLATCALGPRIDVLGGPVPDGVYSTAPKFVGAGESVLVVAPYPDFIVDLPDVPVLFAIDVKTGETVWTKSAPGNSLRTHQSYTDGGQNNPEIVDISVGTFGNPVAYRILASAQTGETLAEAEDFEDPSYSLGGRRFAYSPVLGNEHAVHIHDGTTATKVPGATLTGGDVYAGDDGKGNGVVVGPYGVGEEKTLGYVGPDNAVHPLLTPKQFTDLNIKVHGFSKGEVYISTTDEVIKVGLDGKQIGNVSTSTNTPSDQWPSVVSARSCGRCGAITSATPSFPPLKPGRHGRRRHPRSVSTLSQRETC